MPWQLVIVDDQGQSHVLYDDLEEELKQWPGEIFSEIYNTVHQIKKEREVETG